MTVPKWARIGRPLRVIISLMVPAVAWSVNAAPRSSDLTAAGAAQSAAAPDQTATESAVTGPPATELSQLAATPAAAPATPAAAPAPVAVTPEPTPQPSSSPSPTPAPAPTPPAGPAPDPASDPTIAAAVTAPEPAEPQPAPVPDATVTAATAVSELITPEPVVVSAAAARALAWAQSELISPDPSWSNELNRPWSGYCEAFVEIAYGTRYRYPSATAHYQSQRKAGLIHTDLNPPAGALVFYSGGRYGHVALSTGDGRVITTWGHDGDRYDLQHIDLLGFTNPYLGWSAN